MAKRKLKTWYLMPLSLVALAALAVFVWMGRGDFSTRNVVLSIEGPDQVENGQREDFFLVIENNSDTALSGLNLFLELPPSLQEVNGEGSLSQGINRVEAGERKEIGFSIVASSEKSQETINARLDYSPEGVSARFVAIGSKDVVIGSLDVSMVFDLPSVIYTDQEISGTLHIIPNSDIEASPIYLKLDFPENFVLQQVNPQFDQDNIWRLGTLRSGDSIKREFRGRVSSGAPLVFRAQMGQLEGVTFLPFNSLESTIDISGSPIVLEQTVDSPSPDGAQPGDRVSLRVNFTNHATIPFEEGRLNVTLPTNLVDMSSVSAQNAEVDEEAGTITWNQNQNPSLRFTDVGEGGEFSLQFDIREDLIPQNAGDTNRVVEIRARLSSESDTLSLDGAVLTAETTTNLRIMTDLTLEQDVSHDSGPNPPESDNLSVYTVSWTLNNTFNRANSVRVEAVLPPYGSWHGEIEPNSENVQFVEDSNTIVWTIDELEAGVGYVRPGREVEFKVGLSPTSQDISDGLNVVELTKLTGTDAFTGLFLEQNIEAVSP